MRRLPRLHSVFTKNKRLFLVVVVVVVIELAVLSSKS